MRRKLESQTVEVKGNAKKLQSEEFYNLYSLRKGQLTDGMAIGEMRNAVFYDHQMGRNLLYDKEPNTLTILKLI
jgi:hypothetical protein